MLPRVVHILQSRDVWSAIREETESNSRVSRTPPLYHIGEIDPNSPDTLLREPNVPWKVDSGGDARFRRLAEGVSIAWQRNNHYARLEHALDNYFQALWSLGLSLPLKYVRKHPFALTGTDVSHFFVLPDRRGETQLQQVAVGPRQTIGSVLGLPDPQDSVQDFDVNIDGVQLYRPIRYEDYPATSQAFQGPVMFIGHATPDLSKIPETQRGGPLSFSGYFFWTPRVVPQEHNGLLIRINGASGTLFDSTFLKYQVGERRLSQLVAEVFVHSGLDGALNIDRESFNTAHPHYQVLANWVHNCLRLIRNTLKALQSNALKQRKSAATKTDERVLTTVVNRLIREATDYDPSEIPDVVLVDDSNELEKAIAKGKLVFLRGEIIGSLSEKKADEPWIEAHAIAIARLLEAFGLFDSMERPTQASLVSSILKVFITG